jgi:hypothetical protein
MKNLEQMVICMGAKGTSLKSGILSAEGSLAPGSYHDAPVDSLGAA